MGPAILILNVISVFFILIWMLGQLHDFRRMRDKRLFFSYKRFRHGIALLAIIGIPLLLVKFIPSSWAAQASILLKDFSGQLLFSALFAAGISLIWTRYIRSIDYFEPERSWHLMITFLLSAAITASLVLKVYQLAHSLGLPSFPSDSALYDLFYSIFIIGGIEEAAKIIPVLLIIRYLPKVIDEPIDYIVYGSISALGFAFVENINYIYQSQLYNIGGRALYAAVAHMTFTSTICYGLMLRRFLKRKYQPRVILIAALLSIAGHGFYDFWLIHWDGAYGFVTTIFFLITIQIWFRMKNNAMNLSMYYDKRLIPRNDRLRHYLIVSLSSLLMAAYLIVFLMDGSAASRSFLIEQVAAFGYLIFYLAFGLSRYQVYPNRLYKFRLPMDWFIPRPVERE